MTAATNRELFDEVELREALAPFLPCLSAGPVLFERAIADAAGGEWR